MIACLFYLLSLLGVPDHTTYARAYSNQLIDTYREEQERLNTKVYLKQLDCLETVLYHESRGEGVQGKRLVAQVIINRTAHPNYPKDVCKVVKSKQYNNGKNMLQNKPPSYKLVTARKVAEEALQGKYKKLLSRDTLFFKRCDVDNTFFSKLQLVKKYKQQCFYREA